MASAPPSTERLAMTLFMRANLGRSGGSFLEECDTMAEDYRGILNPREGFRHFRLARRKPAADLAWCLERHWIVEWDLPESEPYRRRSCRRPRSISSSRRTAPGSTASAPRAS